MSCVQFWAQFWPSFISTLLGVIIAVPFSLWINRVFVREADDKKKATEKSFLIDAFTLLQKAIGTNKTSLEDFLTKVHLDAFPKIQGCEYTKPPMVTGVDTSTWEILKGEIVTLSDDIVLKRDLSLYFNSIYNLNSAHRQYLQFFNGVMGMATGTSNDIKHLHDYIEDASKQLITTSSSLFSALEANLNIIKA